MKRARYICFEGTEGVGKTTQTQKLVDYLRSKGYRVLQTKEPGTHHSPLTMQLRGIMLDNQYDEQLTAPARELISQAIRSIHLEKVVAPAIFEYDFIIQDRGALSGLAYGTACGNSTQYLEFLANYVIPPSLTSGASPYDLYDDVIYLRGNINEGLKKAMTSKQEFTAGDAMESRGSIFMQDVANNMSRMGSRFNLQTINVDYKTIDEVFSEILSSLNIKD
jgi:dTMP kinase